VKITYKKEVKGADDA